MQDTVSAHFRKTGHVCGMNEKGNILINLGQFTNPLNSMQMYENARKIQKGH